MTETKVLFGVLMNDETFEVESNDRKLKIALVRVQTILEGQMQERYRTYYWVKDDKEWQKVDNCAFYDSPKEFLNTLDNSDDFTCAIADIRQQMRDKEITTTD